MTATAESTQADVGLAPIAWAQAGAIAAAAAVAHLAVASRFGWHRDEFYYVTTGRHLAWGYPDQPPVASLVARAAAAFPGGVLPLRIVAIAAQAGCILMAALIARELGGRWRAQALAAGCIAASPIFIGASILLGTTVLDQLAWGVVLVLVAQALRRGTLISWVAAGVAAGVGLETKQTLVVLLAGIALGLVLTRREVLRTAGPWVAGVIAAVIWAPNLDWDATHHWQNLSMAKVLSSRSGGPIGSLIQLPGLLLFLAGPGLVVIWFAGARWLRRDKAGRPHRWLLVVAAVAVVVFTAAGGKIYYPAPVLIALFAAGAVKVESRIAAGGSTWRRPVLGVTVSAVITTFLLLPFLSITALDNGVARALTDPVIETYGWPSLASQVTRAAATVPGATAIFTSNYGEAGALARFGPPRGLRLPVLSGQNAYGDWGPPKTGTPDVVVAIGEFDATYLRQFWGDVTEIEPIVMPHHIIDEETSKHAAIYVCRDPKGSWAVLWPELVHLS